MNQPSDLRVLLWDIDGTLMRSARPGDFKTYVAPALEGVFGTSGRLAELTVSGMTDLQIVCEALRDEGLTHEHVKERLGELSECYMAEMERVTSAHDDDADEGARFFRLLPGVREALAAVEAHPRYLSALLTGNIEPAAQLKLRLTGLSDFFQKLPGAFGDDSHDRRDLPALAAARINQHLKLDLTPAHFIVIGDTPNDIDCAKHFGARSVAVATGRLNSFDTLSPHDPDAILPDLSDTELVLETFGKL